MALSAGAKKILMAAAAKKAARKAPVKVAAKSPAKAVTAAIHGTYKPPPLPPFDATPAMLKALPPLKPCRFCKQSKASLRTGLPCFGFWVHCLNTECFAGGPRRSTHLDAVLAWNK